jgi:hypothetical protein
VSPAFEPLPLNESTLLSLLSEGTERPGLDYKRECDLSKKSDLVELTKDLGANQPDGGYIVIGADDQGRPSGNLTEEQAGLFDQATLHSKVEGYLADGFEVRSTPLQVDGAWFALICVLPHPDVLAPFKKDGAYEDKKPFRKGDIFARHGTKSERANAEDIRRAREEIRRQERSEARMEFQNSLHELQASVSSTQAAASAPIGAITWQLDSETFVNAVLEQVRRNDLIPVTLLLKGAPRDAAELAEKGAGDDFETLLDRLSCLSATLMTVDQVELANRVTQAFADIYDMTFDIEGMERSDLQIDSNDLRLRVIGRIWALGGLAVREKHWQLVRNLTMQRPAAYDADYWRTWLFHGLIKANRAGLLDEANHRPGKSPLVVAQEHVQRLGCLHPDLAADDERILTSLCQFDLLACMTVMSDTEGRRREAFLPNFAWWYSSRTDPIVIELIENDALRQVIFPSSDQELADALRQLAGSASKMRSFNRIAGWNGYEAEAIQAFLNEHPPVENTT